LLSSMTHTSPKSPAGFQWEPSRVKPPVLTNDVGQPTLGTQQPKPH